MPRSRAKVRTYVVENVQPQRRSKWVRLSIVLRADEHDEFRGAALAELGSIPRRSGEGAPSEVLRRLIRGYMAQRKAVGQ